MKSFYIFAIVFFLLGVSSVYAQDLIVLKNGEIIEARVLEITPSEIRYKRIEHLDGPTIVIHVSDVLSIRYENGRQEIINDVPEKRSGTSAIDTEKFIFGVNANAGGALGYIWGGGTGTGINIELGKGNFNSEINIIFPTNGFGFLLTFNGFWPSKIGGFYLGGGTGLSIYKAYGYKLIYGVIFSPVGEETYENYVYDYYTFFDIPIGLNIGYKFVTKSGIYFRTGVYTAFNLSSVLFKYKNYFYFKPDLSIGWTMRWKFIIKNVSGTAYNKR